MAADPITWPVAISILGGVVVACVTFAGFLRQAFKRDTPWKEPLDKLTTTVVRLETQVSSIAGKLDDLQKSLDDHEDRDEKDFDRIHERLEKVTDLMIDMLREDSPSSDKSRK